MDLLAVASGVGHEVMRLTAEGEAEALFQVNLFQVIIAAANFLFFLAIIWTFAFKPVSKMLADRKATIEQGLKDAEQARRDRESAESERVATIAEARRESNDILVRAQKVAQESRGCGYRRDPRGARPDAGPRRGRDRGGEGARHRGTPR
ncbi:MAG: ATP synthase F0 subunit B [Candidatus Limnocylindrales bacterium]